MGGILRYASNAAWMAGERVLRIITSVFLLAFIARYLGPERFGLLKFSGCMKLAASVASVIALALAASGSAQVPADAVLLIVVVSAGNLFLAFDVIELYFQSRVLARHTAIYKSASFFTISAVKLALVALQAPLLWFAVAHTLEWALIAALAAGAYLRHATLAQRWSFSSARARSLLRESWPEIGAGFATVLCLRLDQIMIEALVGVEAVGIYSAATRLSDLWYFIPTAIVSSAFPAIIESRDKPGTAYHDDLRKLFLVAAAVAYAIALVTVLLAPLAISVLFGAGYESGTPLLRVHIWSLVAMSLGLCSGSWIFAEGRITLSLYRMAIGAAVNAVLNWVLIPMAGPQGAAVATVVSLFTAYYLFDLLVPSMRHLFIMKSRALLLIGLADYGRSLMARTRT